MLEAAHPRELNGTVDSDDSPAHAGKIVDAAKATKMLPDDEFVPVLVEWLRNEQGIVFKQANFERSRMVQAFQERPVYWVQAPLCWDGYRIRFQYGGETIYVQTAKSLFS